MDIYTTFIDTFRNHVKKRYCRGIDQALQDFDDVCSQMLSEYGSIPNLKAIRHSYGEMVRTQTSWGYKQLTRALNEIVWDIRLC